MEGFSNAKSKNDSKIGKRERGGQPPNRVHRCFECVRELHNVYICYEYRRYINQIRTDTTGFFEDSDDFILDIYNQM